MGSHYLDEVRRKAHSAYNRGEGEVALSPELVMHLIDSIATLMDSDSLFATGQRIAKDAIDEMIAARAERDTAQARIAKLEGLLREAQDWISTLASVDDRMYLASVDDRVYEKVSIRTASRFGGRSVLDLSVDIDDALKEGT